MPGSNLHSDFPPLIYKYLSGNASDAEVQELEAWVLADPANREAFIAYKKAWMLSGMQQEEVKMDIDKLWQATSKQLPEAKMLALKGQKSRRRWLAMAASIAVVLAAGVWLFQQWNPGALRQVVTTDTVKSFDLPDGSQITLNQASSLDYLSIESDPERKVALEGDAYFDVVRDETRPFIIKTQTLDIEVLGTAFYVDARKNQDEIQVIVNSGSVAVRSGGSEAILTAGQKAIYQKSTRQLQVIQNEDANYLSIKTDTLDFENTKLEEVAFALSRHFNVKVSIENEAIKDCELTAVYKDKTLPAILAVLETSLKGIRAQQIGDRVVLSGISCD